MKQILTMMVLAATPLLMAPGSDPCGACLKAAYDVEVYGPTVRNYNFTYDSTAGPQEVWSGRVELTIHDGGAGLDLAGAVLEADCGANGNVAYCDFVALQAQQMTIRVDVPSWAFYDIELF